MKMVVCGKQLQAVRCPRKKEKGSGKKGKSHGFLAMLGWAVDQSWQGAESNREKVPCRPKAEHWEGDTAYGTKNGSRECLPALMGRS
jgi:hypothetical protein